MLKKTNQQKEYEGLDRKGIISSKLFVRNVYLISFLFLFLFLFNFNFISADYAIGKQDGYGIGAKGAVSQEVNYTEVNVNNSQFLRGYTWETNPYFKFWYNYTGTGDYYYNQTSASNNLYLNLSGTNANQNINIGNNNFTVNGTTLFVDTNKGKVTTGALTITGLGGTQNASGLVITGLGSTTTKGIDLVNSGLTATASKYPVYIDSNNWWRGDGVLYLKTGFRNPNFELSSTGLACRATTDTLGLGYSSTQPTNYIAEIDIAGINATTDAGTIIFRTGLNASRQTEKVRINNNGNVGIGTTAPDGKLTIISNQTADGGVPLYIKQTDNNKALIYGYNPLGYLTFRLTNAGNNGVINMRGTSTDTVQIHTGGDTFFNGGNVGIGIIPTSLLDLNGSNPQIKIRANDSGTGTIGIDTSGYFYTKSSSGLAYFNTASKRNQVYIFDYLQNADSTTYSQLGGVYLQQINAGNTMTSLSSAGNSYVNLGLGNFGVKIASPTRTLEVNGTFNVTSSSYFQGDVSYLKNQYWGNSWGFLGSGFAWRDNGAGSMNFYNTSGQIISAIALTMGGTTYFKNGNGGYFGIGVTPTSKLDVSQNVKIGSDTGADSRTNATTKYGKVLFPHYNNHQADVSGLAYEGGSTNPFISIGGGYSSYNAINELRFYTAPNSTTRTGTEKMRIDEQVNISTNLNVAGNITGNNYYGEYYNKVYGGFETIDLVDPETYVKITNSTCGLKNGFTCTDKTGNLTAIIGGVYKVSFTLSAEAVSTAGEYGTKLFVNGVGQNNCYAFNNFLNGDSSSGGFNCLVRLNANDVLNIGVDDHASPVRDLVINSMNLNLMRVGN